MTSAGHLDILYASNLYPPAMGGAQLHLHRLAQEMQRKGDHVSVVTHSCRHRTDWLRFTTVLTEPDMHLEYEGIPVWQIGFPLATRLQILPWAAAYYALIGPSTKHIAKHVTRLLEQLTPPDLVHATRLGREFLCRGALDYARRHNRPYVLTPVHHPRWHGHRYTAYDQIYRESDALLVLTHEEKRTLIEQKKVASDRIHVTGIGPVLSSTYDVDAFRQQYNLHRPFVLYLGQQYRYKGVGAVLEAAAIVLKSNPDVDFVFAGPQTKYSRTIFAGSTDPRIRNLGELSLEMKTAALHASEFLCLPSSQESFGGVYVEAWSAGKAVIGGQILPIAELIQEGVDGLLSTQQPSELAERINWMLANPARRDSMAEAGRAKVEERYTWQRLAETTRAVYQSLI